MFLSKKSVQEKITLLSIDFTKPWWQLIIKQKLLMIAITSITIIVRIFWSISPFLIAKTLELKSVTACAIFFTVWLLIDCANVYSRQLNASFQLQCIHSIYQNAHLYLLTIDPRYHVHRSSGSILGKIDRAARGYEDLLDQLTFEFIPLIVGLVTMIITISQFSVALTVGITITFIAIVIGGYYFALYICQPWEKGFIATDDAFRSTAVENLAQVQLVRATFASDYMNNKLTNAIQANARSEGNLWISYITATFILNMFYVGTIFCLISFLAWQVNAGITTVVSAVGLALAYIHSTKELVTITRPFRRYMRGWTAVNDLFTFIANFGKQSYPVVGPASAITIPETITITAQSISFDYETAQLFNNHTLRLSCNKNQKNKLYGIIGPSGSGKTTLISILGGQIKPITGTVTINGIDVYSITDATRRELISLQGQIATNLRGTVKYNLLFGLPKDHTYDDQHLRALLERVGLLNVLPQGLTTMLGEGGLNLSGGQRQRLNFAGLYLRATHYRPQLILIDEPTSSLDEISETAITQMIIELAQFAITLVIAHRLKTVEQAIGLIDLSLLQQEKDLIPYTPSELLKHSHYYRTLVQGTASLDD